MPALFAKPRIATISTACRSFRELVEAGRGGIGHEQNVASPPILRIGAAFDMIFGP